MKFIIESNSLQLMDYLTVVAILGFFVMLMTVIFFDKVKASFLGLKLWANNIFKENHVEIKGDNNKVRQKTNTSKGNYSERNKSKLEGNENDVEQG